MRVEPLSGIKQYLTRKCVHKDTIACIFKLVILFAEPSVCTLRKGNIIGFTLVSQLEGTQEFVKILLGHTATVCIDLLAVLYQEYGRCCIQLGLDSEAFELLLVHSS